MAGGHEGAVHCVRYNSGGSYVLSSSADKTIRIWNPNTGACIKTFAAHGKAVLGISVSPDNAKFASGSADRSVFLWDVSTGATIRVCSCRNSLPSGSATPDIYLL